MSPQPRSLRPKSLNVPIAVFEANLTDYQFRLYIHLCHLTALEGGVEASTADLGRSTGGASSRTVRRALKALADQDLIEVVVNTYESGMRKANTYIAREVTSVHPDPDTSVHPHVTNDQLDTVANKSVNQQSDKPISLTDLHSKNTSYSYYGGLRPNQGDTNQIKFKEVAVVRRTFDDDEGLQGFGLVDEPIKNSATKPNKRSTKTRARRPQDEWTPMDVAAEFTDRFAAKFPEYHGILPLIEFGKRVGAFRKRYQTDPVTELGMIEVFFADPRNFLRVNENPKKIIDLWFSNWAELLHRAEDLGIVDSGAKVSIVSTDVLTASDGKTFPNTMQGRTRLQHYEERLKR